MDSKDILCLGKFQRYRGDQELGQIQDLSLKTKSLTTHKYIYQMHNIHVSITIMHLYIHLILTYHSYFIYVYM